MCPMMRSYAIRGCEVNAVDFMVKPVIYFNFAEKLENAIRFTKRREERTILLTGEDGVFRLTAYFFVQFTVRRSAALPLHQSIGPARVKIKYLFRIGNHLLYGGVQSCSGSASVWRSVSKNRWDGFENT